MKKSAILQSVFGQDEAASFDGDQSQGEEVGLGESQVIDDGVPIV